MAASQAGKEAVGGWPSHLLFLHQGSVPRAVSQGPRPHLSRIGVLRSQWELVGGKRCVFSQLQAFLDLSVWPPCPRQVSHLRFSSFPLHFPFPRY